MSSQRYHVAYWSDATVPTGGPERVVALLLDQPDGRGKPVAGWGATVPRAMEEIERYLRQAIRRGLAGDAIGFEQVHLEELSVSVSPELSSGQARVALPYEVRVLLPCVWGPVGQGLAVGVLPTLGVRFTFSEHAGRQRLRVLAEREARSELIGQSPHELAALLTPPRVEIRRLVVSVAPRRTRPTERTATLEQLAEPLGPARAWGHETAVSELVGRLRQSQACVAMIGSPRVGKSTVLRQAAQQVQQQSGEMRLGAESLPRFWFSSADRLLAGAAYLGQWQKRLQELIDELSDIDGVLCVGNLTDLIRLGGQGPTDSVAAFLLPALDRGELRVVGEATESEWQACQRLLPRFAERLQPLRIAALSADRTAAAMSQMLQGGRHAGRLQLDPAFCSAVARLHQRFMPYHGLPGPAMSFALDLVEEVADRECRTSIALTAEQAYTRFAELTGLPQPLIRPDLPLPYHEVHRRLEARVVDQPGACAIAAELVLALKAQLNDPLRPIGSLLLAGPTGVGKTELARAVAGELFSARPHQPEQALIRVDLSEYSLPGSATRLIGHPFGEPSQIVQRIREQPFCVLLFDEVDKAHPEVFDLLLGILDEGRLTDHFGRLTDFRSSLILLTSNLGGRFARPMGFGAGDEALLAETADQAAARFFRPELINRLDAIVPFQPLSQPAIHRIAELQLRELAEAAGLRDNRLTLTWSPALLDALAQRGFDPQLGARPLKHAVDQHVATPLAHHLNERPELCDAELCLDWDPREERLCIGRR